MKPDKHKQEKNAAYKKKHGISDGNKQGNKSPGSTDQTRDAKAKSLSDNVQRNNLPTDGEYRSTSDESDNRKYLSNKGEGLTVPPVSAHPYQRRKVVSNWQRYEAEETATPTLRGSDYSLLLKSSANVLSHFQYQAEPSLIGEEWERSNDASAKFLSLDFDDLAASLTCLPLHRRLEIEDSVFEPSSLQQFIEESAANALKYYSQHDEAKPPWVAENNKSLESVDLMPPKDSVVDAVITSVPSQAEQPIHAEELKTFSLEAEAPELTSGKSVESSSNVTPGQHLIVADGASVAMKEEERKDQSVIPTVSCAKTGGQKGGSVPQSKPSLRELENELDLLLSM